MSKGLIATVLTESIERQHRKNTQPADRFRMSSCGHCPRKQIAMRAGLPEVFPPNDTAILKMWHGTEYGKLIQATLEAEGFLERSWTEREVRYRSYVGHVDGLTRKLPDDGTQGAAIVEIKTTADASIKNYDWPDHYPWQGGIYLLATGLRRELMFQIGREYGLNREKVFILTEEWKSKIESHITMVEGLWDVYTKTKVLPPCDHQFAWENKLCGYREAKAVVVDVETSGAGVPRAVVLKAQDLGFGNPGVVTKEQRELSDFIDEANKQGDLK